MLMRAMLLRRPGDDHAAGPLQPASIPAPVPSEGEVLVRVSVCGVCRTDLDIVEGRLLSPRYPIVPGHQVIGRVVGSGTGVNLFREGDRIGIAWIHSACGVCRWCLDGAENLCPKFKATGCDANGGYAEYVTVPAEFAHVIPAELSDEQAAPLLCAGAIGWRSLRLAAVRDGEPLGLTGFGASGHLVLQLVRHAYPSSPLYVFARGAEDRAFALELGAAWAGEVGDHPPAMMGAVIDTTPAWKPVVEALRHIVPGGRLVVNAIRKVDTDKEELLRLDYASHLWMEREIKSVANVTRADVREMLAAAVEMGVRPTVTELPLDRANEALAAIRGGAARRGATVLRLQ